MIANRVLTFCVVLAVAGGCEQASNESIEKMNRGVDAYNAGQTAKAISELESALTLNPENHSAAWTLAQIHMKQGDWDKMVDALQTATKYAPDEGMYHYQLGHAYVELGKWDMAKQALEEAIDKNDRLFKAHWYLGRVHLAQDRPKEAAEEWNKAASLNPNFGKPFINLGKLYYKWDYFDEAAKVLVQGAQYARDNEDLTDIYYNLGRAQMALKQTDQAIGSFEKAIEARSDNILAKFNLGMAVAEKGDGKKAKEILDEFIKSGGGGDAFALQAANDRVMRIQRAEYEKEAADKAATPTPPPPKP